MQRRSFHALRASKPSCRRRHGLRALTLAALTLLLFLAGAASAARIVYGDLVVFAEGGFKPTALPARHNAPITLWTEGKISTISGDQPPRLREVELEFDRHGSLVTSGLASCTAPQLEGATVAQARQACPKAIVGEGYGQATVSSPQAPPYQITLPITLFNGPHQGGDATILAYAYGTVPAPTAYVVPIVIEPIHDGPYGYRLKVAIPEIDNGAAIPTAVHIRAGRFWTFRSHRYSYLNARCEVGFLEAHGKFSFANGLTVSGSVSRPCTVRR